MKEDLKLYIDVLEEEINDMETEICIMKEFIRSLGYSQADIKEFENQKVIEDAIKKSQ